MELKNHWYFLVLQITQNCKRLLTREEALELYFSLPDDPTSSDSDRDTDEDFAPELAPPDSDERSSEAEAAESTRKPQKRKATYSRKKRRQKKVPRICDEAEVEEEEVGAWNSSEPDAVIRVPKIWDPQYSANLPTTPCEAFALYFDEGIMNTLVTETNRFAEQKGRQLWKELTIDELRAYFGILLLMSTNPRHQMYLYWSSDSFFHLS
ncbi:hypothetical protein MRX96_050121 [Rhipicephalus microplus]